MSLAKADPLVAESYLELGGRPDLVAVIREEFRRTRALVTGPPGPAASSATGRCCARPVDLRNPYVDALSFLQVRFLTDLRNGLSGAGGQGRRPGPADRQRRRRRPPEHRLSRWRPACPRRSWPACGAARAEAPAFLDSYRRPAQRAVRANPLKLDPADLPACSGSPPTRCRGARRRLPPRGAPGRRHPGPCGRALLRAGAVGPGRRGGPDVRPGPAGARPGGRPRRQGHPGRRPARRPGVVVANEVQRGRVQALADNLDRWGSGRTMLAAETVARLAERLPGGSTGSCWTRPARARACSGATRPPPPSGAPATSGQRRAPARPCSPTPPAWSARRRARLLDLHLRPRGERAAGGRVPDRPPRLGAAGDPAHEGFAPAAPTGPPAAPRAGPDRPPVAPPPARRRPLHRQAGRPGGAREPPRARRGPRRGATEPGEGGAGCPQRRGRWLDAWRGFAPRPWRATRGGRRWSGNGPIWCRRRGGRGRGAAGAAGVAGGAGAAGEVRAGARAGHGGGAAGGPAGQAAGGGRGRGLGAGGGAGHQGPGGWTVVAWNGWPLGWGRAVGGSLKNHYPKGLRTMRP
jgi:hypothetical protein